MDVWDLSLSDDSGLGEALSGRGAGTGGSFVRLGKSVCFLLLRPKLSRKAAPPGLDGRTLGLIYEHNTTGHSAASGSSCHAAADRCRCWVRRRGCTREAITRQHAAELGRELFQQVIFLTRHIFRPLGNPPPHWREGMSSAPFACPSHPQPPPLPLSALMHLRPRR